MTARQGPTATPWYQRDAFTLVSIVGLAFAVIGIVALLTIDGGSETAEPDETTTTTTTVATTTTTMARALPLTEEQQALFDESRELTQATLEQMRPEPQNTESGGGRGIWFLVTVLGLGLSFAPAARRFV